ncbi:MAG: hypothetical protein NVS3B26_04310 [Mycobacteriales bacterium]
MNGPQITVVGHVARPPRSRILAGGTVVADFRMGTTPRRFDKATGQWSDLETLWFDVTCWRSLAEHATSSLQKGDRVVVTGRLLTTSWTGPAGELRTGLEIDAASVGLDFSRGPVTQTRVERAAGPGEEAWTTPPVEADPLAEDITAEVAA